MRIIKHAPEILTIPGFWSEPQCDAFIARSERIGYEAATIETERGQRRVESVRNNNRVLYSDEALAATMWETLAPLAPPQIGFSRAVGLNELFRFYRYEPGQQFRSHRDQSFIRSETEASYYTFMIYLNDDFEGGATRFESTVVAPRQGTALLFLHDLAHEGSPVLSGTKYVLRTDIMYRLEEEQHIM